jgi:hypothetical protein
MILNAAALAAASPTLLFSDWYNAARLKRNESEWLRCVKCASVSQRQKGYCYTNFCTNRAVHALLSMNAMLAFLPSTGYQRRRV